MMKIRNRKGFTLIEMMVVIAIVAVLVAITVPTVIKARVKAQASTDAANLRALSASIATRYVTTTDDDELKAGIENPDSKIAEGSHVMVYRIDKEVRSYFNSSLLNTSSLRGNDYNGAVSISGDLDEAYDVLPAEAELLCILSGDGRTPAEIVMAELSSVYTAKKDDIKPGLVDKYADDLVNTKAELAWIDAFLSQYEKDYVDLAHNTALKIKIFGREMSFTYAEAQEKYGSLGTTAWTIAAEALAAAEVANYRNALNNGQSTDGILTLKDKADDATTVADAAKDAYLNSEEAANDRKNALEDAGDSSTLAGAVVDANAGTAALGQMSDTISGAAGVLGSDWEEIIENSDLDQALKDAFNGS